MTSNWQHVTSADTDERRNPIQPIGRSCFPTMILLLPSTLGPATSTLVGHGQRCNFQLEQTACSPGLLCISSKADNYGFCEWAPGAIGEECDNDAGRSCLSGLVCTDSATSQSCQLSKDPKAAKCNMSVNPPVACQKHLDCKMPKPHLLGEWGVCVPKNTLILA